VAAVLAMGPAVIVRGRAIVTGPYIWLYNYVPGFDGLRVPGRLIMITVLFLSVAAGIGAAWLIERWKARGTALVVAGALVMLAEGWVAPMDVGKKLWPGVHFAMTDFDLPSAKTLSPVYVMLRDLPEPVVVGEFPFGEPTYDTRWTFMAGFHRRKTINGFSGAFPESFRQRSTLLFDPMRQPAAAWSALMEAGVTHVVVHEKAFNSGKGEEISAWLRASGARELVSAGDVRLFALR
jgi:hypothetical protein